MTSTFSAAPVVLTQPPTSTTPRRSDGGRHSNRSLVGRVASRDWHRAPPPYVTRASDDVVGWLRRLLARRRPRQWGSAGRGWPQNRRTGSPAIHSGGLSAKLEPSPSVLAPRERIYGPVPINGRISMEKSCSLPCFLIESAYTRPPLGHQWQPKRWG